MGIEHLQSPANDNFPEADQAELDRWLENFRAKIDQHEQYAEAQRTLAALMQKTEVYLRSPKADPVVVNRLEIAIQSAMTLVMEHAHSMPFPEMDKVAKLYADIAQFRANHEE